MHVPPSGPHQPALQVQLLKVVLCAGELESSGQLLQFASPAALLYLPATHAAVDDGVAEVVDDAGAGTGVLVNTLDDGRAAVVWAVFGFKYEVLLCKLSKSCEKFPFSVIVRITDDSEDESTQTTHKALDFWAPEVVVESGQEVVQVDELQRTDAAE